MKLPLQIHLVGTLLLGALIQSTAFAAGTVNTADEASLRAALAGGGTVTFTCDGTILLTNTLTIAANTVIDATGHSIALDGGGAIRLLEVTQAVKLDLRNLTLLNGRVAGGKAINGANGADAKGAALLISGGTVNMTGCRVWTNTVQGGAGSDWVYIYFPTIHSTNGSGGSGSGGAISVINGTLNATNSEFTGNTATGGPGGTSASFPATSSGSNGWGGAIYSQTAMVTLSSCRLAFNCATGGSSGDPGAVSGPGAGGAIFNNGGTLLITSSLFESNTG